MLILLYILLIYIGLGVVTDVLLCIFIGLPVEDKVETLFISTFIWPILLYALFKYLLK